MNTKDYRLMTYELHPLCTLFPRLSGAEFNALRDDIKANGLRQPIVLLDGMVLDGGNRYRACVEAGVEPAFTEFHGGDPISFVLSANFHRRHLSAGQQAAIVSSVTNWAQARKQGGDRRSDQAASLAGLYTVAERAVESGASVRTQRMADKVAKADPELARKVAHGDITLPDAMEQITGKRPGAKPAKVEPEPEYEGPSADEIAEARKSAEDDAEAVRLLLESDDKLAAMTEKCAQQAALIRTLESRIKGLMAESKQQIQMINRLRRQVEKAAA